MTRSLVEAREWHVRRDHGGGWHHVVDGSGIIRADVFGSREALRVCRVLADRKGETARAQTEDDVCDPMFTKAMRESLCRHSRNNLRGLS